MEIKINNLNYKNYLKINELNVNSNILIVGTSSSGKTLLLKYLEETHNVSRVYRINYFYNNTVEDEIRYLILNEVQKNFVKKFIPNVNLKLNPNEVLKKDKIKIAIIKFLIKANDYISFDNILGYLNKEELNLLFDYLTKNNIKSIIVSNTLKECVYTDNILILHNGEIIGFGDTDKMIQEEKIYRKLGIKLPFSIELSYRLKDYNLIDKIYYDEESMVDNLWK